MANAIIFFISAVILYLFAPLSYSQNYCIIIFALYCLSSFWFLHKTFDGNYFNFHILFVISFFFVSFAYPIFIYPIDPYHFSVFKRPFDHDIITKATALSLLGINSYFLGAGLTKNNSSEIKYNYTLISPKSYIQLLTITSYIFFVIIIANSWKLLLNGQFGSMGNRNQYILVLFQISFELAMIIEIYETSKRVKGKIIDLFFHFNKQLLFLTFIFIILFIRIGDRGPIIQLLLILLATSSTFVIKLNLKKFLIILILGMFTLTFISYARTNFEDTKDINTGFFKRGLNKLKLDSFLDLGMDLIITNRNLYVGMKYADQKGISYGKNFFPYLFAPIPLMPTIMSKVVFNSTPAELNSDYIITTLGLGKNATWGLGTHIIADIYMSFGSFGVILFMIFLGQFVRKIQITSKINNNIQYLFIYYIMVSFSIYLPRAPYFIALRYIFWTIIFYYFIQEITKHIIKIQTSIKSNVL